MLKFKSQSNGGSQHLFVDKIIPQVVCFVNSEHWKVIN